tara:strand:- start:746 stop:1663 length:918 start_codon:yes stop_codon:yes gene_type:complete
MSERELVWYVGQDFEPNKETYEYYKTQYVRFKKATRKILLVSYGSGGVLATHPKENLCATLCKKLSVTARSLYMLAPDPNSKEFFQQHLDFTSSATIARALVSNFAMLYHFGIEACSEDEFRTRQLLMWWRDYRVRRKMNFAEGYRERADAFHDPDLRRRLNENKFWLRLPDKTRRHILRSNHLLHSEEEILERAGADKETHIKMYAYWSAHAHCDSVSFINMDEQRRGSGQVNVGDIAMLGTTLEWINGFLEHAAKEVDDIFAGAEERASKIKNLDLLSNKTVSMPWAGKLTLEQARENYRKTK